MDLNFSPLPLLQSFSSLLLLSLLFQYSCAFPRPNLSEILILLCHGPDLKIKRLVAPYYPQPCPAAVLSVSCVPLGSPSLQNTLPSVAQQCCASVPVVLESFVCVYAFVPVPNHKCLEDHVLCVFDLLHGTW